MMRIGMLFLFLGTLLSLYSTPVDAHVDDRAREMADKIEKTYPGLIVERVIPSSLDGLYEVTTEKGKIVYFHPGTGHIIAGEILTSDGRNLTSARKAEIAAAIVNNLPLSSAIRIGEGEQTIIEIVDPDCPFCRKAEKFFETRSDVTRYIYLLPIIQLHPDAERKSLYTLCAPNRTTAYREVLAGRLDDRDFQTCNDREAIDLLAEHKRIAGQLGVSGTPTFWVNGHRVDGADFTQITAILDRGTNISGTPKGEGFRKGELPKSFLEEP
ncbi:MAG: DsbC family protein [Candidatus Manganitrophaceae bacterium]